HRLQRRVAHALVEVAAEGALEERLELPGDELLEDRADRLLAHLLRDGARVGFLAGADHPFGELLDALEQALRGGLRGDLARLAALLLGDRADRRRGRVLDEAPGVDAGLRAVLHLLLIARDLGARLRDRR